MTSKLNSVELCIYFCVWITATLYSLYNLFQVQSVILKRHPEEEWTDLEPGWEFISRYRDVSDLEWNSWKYFIQTSWYYLMLHFIISEVIRITIGINSILKYWYILSSVIFIVLFMGIKQMMLLVLQPIVYLVIIFAGGKKCIVWIISIGLLISYNVVKYTAHFWAVIDAPYLPDEEVFLVMICLAWIELRCVSFSIEYIDRQDKQTCSKNAGTWETNTMETTLNMLCYVLYLPLLITGPVVLYEDFERSFKTKGDDITLRLRRFMLDMVLFLIYTFVLDIAFHYLYFYAMHNEIEAISELPTMALCGGGLWMGLEFHMKYVISYGTASAFARLDNVDSPPTPRCVARIHVYSQMWRYFDVGLYKFLVKYIYKPSLGVLSQLSQLPQSVQKLTASFATFVFIFIWHGTLRDVLVWSTLNFLGITLEYAGKAMSYSETYKWFKREILRTDEMEVRFLAFVCTPLLIMSAISNFYLFAGETVGNVFIECFLQPSLNTCLFLTFVMYCCCQVSIALQHVPSRTDFKIQRVECKATK